MFLGDLVVELAEFLGRALQFHPVRKHVTAPVDSPELRHDVIFDEFDDHPCDGDARFIAMVQLTQSSLRYVTQKHPEVPFLALAHDPCHFVREAPPICTLTGAAFRATNAAHHLFNQPIQGFGDQLSRIWGGLRHRLHGFLRHILSPRYRPLKLLNYVVGVIKVRGDGALTFQLNRVSA